MQDQNTIVIADFRPEHAAAFRQLNLSWLEAYGLLEPPDLEVLNDPMGRIVDRGGKIFVALSDGSVVGSAALAPDHPPVFELVKMAVAEGFRGRGISRLLMDRCLAEAKNLGAQKLVLFSNHQLQAALHLYQTYGFQQVPVVDSPFATADVRMELTL